MTECFLEIEYNLHGKNHLNGKQEQMCFLYFLQIFIKVHIDLWNQYNTNTIRIPYSLSFWLILLL